MEAVQKYWEEGDLPPEVRAARWQALLEEYDDLPFDLKAGIAVKVGKRVERSLHQARRREQRPSD